LLIMAFLAKKTPFHLLRPGTSESQ
jgi:hypothetical protein